MGGFWELCWKMLAPRWCFFEYHERCCGILVPRWRAGAPRRGKIGELRRRGLLLGGRDPCDRQRASPLHPPKNGFSRMGLQKGSPDSDSNWNWIWKTGRLEDWKTGSGKLEDLPSAGLYTQLCLRHGGGYVYIYIYIYICMCIYI